jgi:hypothetical protein
MAAIRKAIKLHKVNTILAIVFALVGGAIYLWYSIQFANTQRSTIDEGLFLYKGYLFASGVYHPFQVNGPHTEYGPLSYLIPGYIQLWFGAGLQTGRVFAVVVGILGLAGLWGAAKRLGGSWWATGAVWVAVLNPAVIRFYSFGISQGLVSCLLMWALFLALGSDRRVWETALSSVLAGLILLTRQNMAPVLPILLIYIFWQYGRKHGLIATLAGAIVVMLGHAIFWPGILMMWAPWLPASLTPFLDAWRLPAGSTAGLEFHHDWMAWVYSLLEGFRFHFVALVGSIIGLVLWPTRKEWKSEWQYRTGIFLAVLYFVLLGMHIWAGLGFGGINYGNAYTVNPYLAFFTYVGLLLTITVFTNLRGRLSIFRQIMIVLLVVSISLGIGYGDFDSTDEFLLNLHIPRIQTFLRTGKILPGNVPLWEYFTDKFGIAYATSRWLIPMLSGVLVGLLILLVSFTIWSLSKKGKFTYFHSSYGKITAITFMLAGIILSPSAALGGGFNQWQCNQNVIKTYEQAGRGLANTISPKDHVYWVGGNAVAVLLYSPGINVHPQQLDWQWNYYLGGDAEMLARLGYWNDALATQWLQEADVIIIQQEYGDSSLQTYLDSNGYSNVLSTNEKMNCSSDSILLVYRKQ